MKKIFPIFTFWLCLNIADMAYSESPSSHVPPGVCRAGDYFFEREGKFYYILAIRGHFILDDTFYFFDSGGKRQRIYKYLIKANISCRNLFNGTVDCEKYDELENIFLIDLAEPTPFFISLDFEKCFQDFQSYYLERKLEIYARINKFEDLEIPLSERNVIARALIPRTEFLKNIREIIRMAEFSQAKENKDIKKLFYRIISYLATGKKTGLGAFSEEKMATSLKILRPKLKEYVKKFTYEKLKSREGGEQKAGKIIPIKVSEFEKNLIHFYIFAGARFVKSINETQKVTRIFLGDFSVSRKKFFSGSLSAKHCKQNITATKSLNTLFKTYTGFFEPDYPDLIKVDIKKP